MLALTWAAALPAPAQPVHELPPPAAARALASHGQPFGELMKQAMATMDRDMAAAPMNGDADHDFAAMMIPHHQGAIDMARAVLLYGKNPVLRRLAQEIIVTQGSEIVVLRAELDPSAARAARTAAPQR